MTVPPCLTRRTLLLAGGAGLGALGLPGCAGAPDVPELTGVAPGDVLVPLADLPREGAYELSVDGRRLLVARTADGAAVAFDAECTHQGCSVRAVDDGLVCPCHDSAFDPATGEVLQGPATSPLTAVAVAVRGDDVVLAWTGPVPRLAPSLRGVRRTGPSFSPRPGSRSSSSPGSRRRRRR